MRKEKDSGGEEEEWDAELWYGMFWYCFWCVKWWVRQQKRFGSKRLKTQWNNGLIRVNGNGVW